MTVLITGASGKLGRLAALELIRRRAPGDVRLVSRTPEALESFRALGVDVRHADFDDPGSLTGALDGVERMLLVSTMDIAHRTAQQANAIDVAVASGVEHIVYTSIPNAVADNDQPVVPSHMATEQHLRASGVKWTFLRNAPYAEAAAGAALAAARAGVLRHNWGEGEVAWVSREDCARVASTVLAEGEAHAGVAYDVTGPEDIDADAFGAMIEAVSGRPVTIEPQDDAARARALEGEGVPAMYVPAFVSFGRAIRHGLAGTASDTVANLTGRAPVALREVLSASLAAAD